MAWQRASNVKTVSASWHHDVGCIFYGMYCISISWYNDAISWPILAQITPCLIITWWRHQMETVSALLAFCEGHPPVTDGFPSQKPVTQNFEVFFDVRLNKRLSKQWRCWWFETPCRPLWRHCYDLVLWHSLNSEDFLSITIRQISIEDTHLH